MPPLALTAILALALALSPAALAAPDAAPGARPAGGATAMPFASPLVAIERIDALPRGLGPAGGPARAPAAGDGPPAYLLDPDGFTTFGQVAPPDGGQLIMVVE